MKNITNTIANLTEVVKNALTPTEEGRKQVVNACKELYHMIEADVIAADKKWMLTGIYNDLMNGNFAEPFMCEQKKSTFNTVVAIYNERVIPYL